MRLQNTFNETYVAVLKGNISPEKYTGPSFNYDQTEVRPLANVPSADGLLKRMNPNNDLESAIALYECLPSITPIVASKKGLWTYLAHVDLFDYMKKRFPAVEDGSADKDYIQEHWFRNSQGVMRSSLSGLWWSVYCSVDNDRKDKYELTRMLFKNDNIRTHYFGRSKLFRHREALIGILEFLVENADVSDVHFNSRCIYITKYFNRLGAVKQLAYLDRSFFKHELLKKKPILLTITSKAQVLEGVESLPLQDE